MTAGDVYRALWRHWFLITVLTALFVGATWYATSRQSLEYEASTLVRVQERGPTAGDASQALAASQTLAQTYAKIISSGALTEEIRSLVAACARLQRSGSLPVSPGGQSGSATSKLALGRTCIALGVARNSRVAREALSGVHLSASPVQDLDLLDINAQSKRAASAMVVANAAPFALRAFVRRTGPSSEEIAIAKAATLPRSAISRHLALNLVLALMLGVIFNGAVALLLELFRDRLPETDELGQTVGHPVLATIPTLRLDRAAPDSEPGGSVDGALAIGGSFEGERRSGTAGRRAGPGT